MMESEIKYAGGTSIPAQRGKDLHLYTVEVLSNERTLESLADIITPEDLGQVKWCVERSREIFSRFPSGIVLYEEQIDLTTLGISSGKNGCRIDVLIVVPGIGIVVIDFKYGRIWVTPPEWNPQMKSYSWGANNKYGGNVESIVLQPQSPEGRDYMTHVFESDDFAVIGKEIRVIVEATEKEGAPLIRGDHCQKLFCPLRINGVCPLWKKTILDIPNGKNVGAYLSMLSPEGCGEFYEKIKVIKAVADHCEKKCVELAVEHSMKFSGWEVGNGRPTYVCGDTDKFLATLTPFAAAKGVDPLQLTHDPVPRLPKSKSDVHKIIGQSNAAQEAVKGLYVEKPGKKTLKKVRF